MDWGPAGALCAVVLSALGLLWKVRRDEIADLKTSIDLSIQGVVASLKTEVGILKSEIEHLREWRHDFGPKEMVINDHDRRLGELEWRVANIVEMVRDQRKI